MGKLEGKIAIVTGGGRGIGLGSARAMAKEGASIAILEINADTANSAAKELAELGSNSIAIPCDIGTREACEAAVAQVVEKLGGVDVLVNNATEARADLPFLDHSDDDMEAVWRINVMASFWLMQACHPHMAARGGGSIINLGSAAGTAGREGFAAYAAAKEGIRGLSKVAAREWGVDGIRVNVVCPFAASPGLQAWGEADPPRFKALIDAVPLRRAGDCEDDIGRVISFLASDDSSYLTAQTMMVDGGSGSIR